jgi:hypothetical protein
MGIQRHRPLPVRHVWQEPRLAVRSAAARACRRLDGLVRHDVLVQRAAAAGPSRTRWCAGIQTAASRSCTWMLPPRWSGCPLARGRSSSRSSGLISPRTVSVMCTAGASAISCTGTTRRSYTPARPSIRARGACSSASAWQVVDRSERGHANPAGAKSGRHPGHSVAVTECETRSAGPSWHSIGSIKVTLMVSR